MTQEQIPTAAEGLRWRSVAVPLALGLLALVALAAIVVVSQRVGRETTHAALTALQNPIAPVGTNRYVVKQVSGGSVVVAPEGAKDTANVQTEAIPGTPSHVEVMRPVAPSSLQPGDWVAVVGIPNAVRNFSIHAIVAIPSASAGADGVMRSSGGFSGSEAGPQAADQVTLGGKLARVEGATLVLQAASGEVRVDLTARAPLFRIEPAAASAFHEGDLVATNGRPVSDPAAAFLIRPATP